MKGKDRQTAQSETQLRENPGRSSLRSGRADTLLTWKDVRVMATSLLKDHHCSLCDPENKSAELDYFAGKERWTAKGWTLLSVRQVHHDMVISWQRKGDKGDCTVPLGGWTVLSLWICRSCLWYGKGLHVLWRALSSTTWIGYCFIPPRPLQPVYEVTWVSLPTQTHGSGDIPPGKREEEEKHWPLGTGWVLVPQWDVSRRPTSWSGWVQPKMGTWRQRCTPSAGKRDKVDGLILLWPETA